MQIKIKDKNGIILKTNKRYCEEDIPVTVETEELNIIPGITEQINEGLFDKVTVVGDSNLIPENIKKGTEIFGVIGVGKFSEAKITDARYLFHQGARIDCVDEILKLCENVVDTKSMFANCTDLTTIDLSSFDTSNVTDMSYMFHSCTKLTTLNIDNFDTSKVTNMAYMFNNCNNLTELNVSSFNTSKVTNMSTMFYSCSKLTKLDVSNFDVDNVTSTDNMFASCKNLITLDLSNFSTNKVTNMSFMFNYCLNLTTLDLSNFNMDRVINISSAFSNCNNLTNLKFGKDFGKGFTSSSNNYTYYRLILSSCSLLTHESLMSIINNLYDLNLTYDVANGGTLRTQTLNLGATNLAKLTSEEIAIATNKGWTIS